MRVRLSLSRQQRAAVELMRALAGGERALAALAADAVERELRAARPARWRGRRPSPRPVSRARAGEVDLVIAPGSGCALALAAGDRLRVEQIAGGQCVDLCAYARREPGLAFSASRTRALHGVHPTRGDMLWSGAPETPLLEIVADTAPGHDLCFPACTPFEYEPLTGRDDHASCAAIQAATLAHAGLAPRLAPHDPLNLWLPSEVGRDGALRSWPAACRRGDRVDLRALVDLVVVLCPCPDDLYGSSQYEPRAVRVLVRRGERGAQAGRGGVLAPAPAADLGARELRTIELPERLRAPLERMRADGWLGDRAAEVVRALLFRWWERRRTAQG